MHKERKILFIGHEASLSGAPLVLLNLAKWIKNNRNDFKIDVLLLNKGEHFAAYASVFNNLYCLPEPELAIGLFAKIKRTLKSQLGLSPDQKLLKKIKTGRYNVIYCNTVLTTNWGATFKAIFKVKLIVHVHELNAAIRILEPDFKKLSVEVDKFIGVSKSVVNNLVESYNIDANKVDLVYEFIDLKSLKVKEKTKETFFKIGASGFYDWRKGYDLFLLTAYSFTKKYPHIHIKFQWVGGGPDIDAIIIEEDIKKLGLNDIVVFSGKTKLPLDEFNQFDVFLLLSREDPFPLVCLEAGSLGKPIICFEKAGGIPELIADGGGIIVPYLDLEEVVNAIFTYHQNREKLEEDGRVLQGKVSNYKSDILAPKIFEILLKELN